MNSLSNGDYEHIPLWRKATFGWALSSLKALNGFTRAGEEPSVELAQIRAKLENMFITFNQLKTTVEFVSEKHDNLLDQVKKTNETPESKHKECELSDK